MRDWSAFVRSQLSLSDLTAAREARIVRELAVQLEDFYREARARGASEADADAYARAQVRDWSAFARELHGVELPHVRPRLERLADRHVSPRTSRGARMLANLVADGRYALRQMRLTPGFTTVAALTLALGIGATTAMFSVVNGVLLRPLAYPEPESLVRVFEVVPRFGRFSVSPANFLDWRQRQTVFERISVYAGGTDTIIGAEGPERLVRTLVSWDLFELLRVQPALGRQFRADEDTGLRPQAPGAGTQASGPSDVVIISYGLWQRRFGGRNVIGEAIVLSGAPVTIVGVMPAGFYFPTRDTELWRPIALNPTGAPRGAHFTGVIARLKPGITVEEAGAQMKGIAGQLAVEYPQTNRDESTETIAMHDVVVGPIRPLLLTLFGAVAVVVLIACANVANLLLVRASAREKEMAIRAAMGAGRGRLATQMLCESLVLAVVGGALGLLFAWFAMTPVQQLSAGSIPRVAEIALDRTVLGFAIFVSIATGLIFGLAPAWQSLHGRIGAVLKDGTRTSNSSRGQKLRSGLLVVEVALSIVLLVGAALLLRSFAKLTSVTPGFTADNVLTFSVGLPRATYGSPEARIAFFDRLLERLRSTPGIQSAAMVQQLPIRGGYALSFNTDKQAPQTPAESPSANYRLISPDYLTTLEIPLLRGRQFTSRDAAQAPMVALVDETFAARHFPDDDPIGRRIDIGNGIDGYYEIVGVVGNVRHEGLGAAPEPTMYVPYPQDPFSEMSVVVRTSGDPTQFAATVRQVVRSIDADLPAFAIAPLTAIVGDSVATRRFVLLVLSAFAVVAMFLAAVGLYGVVAYAVSQRTQEIGLRMAIGADRGSVLRLVLGGGLKLAALGIAIGVAGALSLTRVVASMLFQVTPFDPASYAATVALLLLVATVACYMPARRAMAVDPLVALRQ